MVAPRLLKIPLCRVRGNIFTFFYLKVIPVFNVKIILKETEILTASLFKISGEELLSGLL